MRSARGTSGRATSAAPAGKGSASHGSTLTPTPASTSQLIALAAFSFLIDFDAADQMIRAGAPEKAAWGIALGLTVTLVWLYIEILRLLSYFNSD